MAEGNWDLGIDDEDRKLIYEWSEKRKHNFHGMKKKYSGFLVYTFNVNTLISFINNFNIMVLLQMILAGVAVYIFQIYDISFNIQITLFVSPIVFPLAFSINTDFQRREKVLDDLANFKSASMMWFFCMREWKEDANLDDEWLKTAHSKLKSILFNLKEYLLTAKADRRKVILRVMYEDFSDTNQLIQKVRLSKPAASTMASKGIEYLNTLCLMFERLRNVREYRSPRSIRSFNKVLIFLLPFILAPDFVKMGKLNENEWSAYYMSVLVAFVFSALQGVQDKLDDPFDGMSEDDINLKTIDEWTFQSLEVTVKRSYKVGRFQVVANIEVIEEKSRAATVISQSPEYSDAEKITKIHNNDDTIANPLSEHRLSVQSNESHNKALATRRNTLKQRFYDRHNFKRNSSYKVPLLSTREYSLDEHPYADVLENIQGDVPIVKRGGLITTDEEIALSSSATKVSIDLYFKEESADEGHNEMLSKTDDVSIDMESSQETSLNSPPLQQNAFSPVGKHKKNYLNKILHLSLSRIDSDSLVEEKPADTSLLADTSLPSSPTDKHNVPLLQNEKTPFKHTRFKLSKMAGHVKSNSSLSSVDA